MNLTTLAFVAGFLFVGFMLFNSFRPRTKGRPPAGDLAERLSPELRRFLASLPLPADHPLSSFCQPWDGHDYVPAGYVKYFFPLWKSSDGAQTYLRKKDKLGAPVEFSNQVPADEEQAFLAGLILEVMNQQDWSNRGQLLNSGRRAAEAVGFRYFDEAVKSLTEWRESAGEDDDPDDAIDYAFNELKKEIKRRS